MSNDLPNGAGRAVYSNGTTYQGDWKVRAFCNIRTTHHITVYDTAACIIAQHM
jgi:outer membrane protein assembly factor BamB